MKTIMLSGISLLIALLLVGCINPPPNGNPDCIDQDSITELKLIKNSDGSVLIDNDEIILPMQEGEEEPLLVDITITPAAMADRVQWVCLVVRDKDLFSSPIIATASIPIAAGETSTRDPLPVSQFTCRDQKVWAGARDTFRPTNEKRTKIFVQAVDSVSDLPTVGQGGTQSPRIFVRCPDVTIRE